MKKITKQFDKQTKAVFLELRKKYLPYYWVKIPDMQRDLLPKKKDEK